MTNRSSSDSADVPPTAGAPRGRAERLFHPFAAEVPVVLVPDVNDGGARHWQALWHDAHPSFVRVSHPRIDTPDLDQWATAARRAIAATRVPPIVVAHGFGCLASIRAVAGDRLALAAAMLVAPADPQRFDALRWLPRERLPYPTLIVASTNDPGLRLTRAATLAQLWGAQLVSHRDGGHLDASSGLEAWPAGIGLLRDLAERAAAAGSLVRAPRRARKAA